VSSSALGYNLDCYACDTETVAHHRLLNIGTKFVLCEYCYGNIIRKGRRHIGVKPEKGRRCKHCGGTIPPEKNAKAIFCSNECLHRYWNAEISKAIIANRGRRHCKGCGLEIPPKRNASTKYCSYLCESRHFARKKAMIQRELMKQWGLLNCPICGQEIPPSKKGLATVL
jgi:predicted nucleic acid-binding Zn ribbon protein